MDEDNDRHAARAELHERLDQILDKREEIEGLAAEIEAGTPFGLEAVKVYRRTLEFAADLCGETVIWSSLQPTWAYGTKEQAILRILANRLTASRRLLEAPGGIHEVTGIEGSSFEVASWRLDIEEVRKQLLDLANGDKTALFARGVRKQGNKSNEYRLARCQVRAFQYNAYLEEAGLKPGVRHRKIATAFGISGWDTIRKWKTPCERILGKETVDHFLSLARGGMIEGQDELGYEPDLAAAGRKYQEALRAGKVG